MHYCEAFSVAFGWKGRVYKYDSTGRKTQVVWVSNDEYASKEEAIDAAVEWCDSRELKSEIDFGPADDIE